MTKRHFEVIARAIRAQLDIHDSQPEHDVSRRTAIIDVAVSLSREFALLNPRFNRERFLRACGFGEES